MSDVLSPRGDTAAVDLRHVGPAVLAALVAVAWWRRNLIVTLVAGMAVLWVGTWLT